MQLAKLTELNTTLIVDKCNAQNNHSVSFEFVTNLDWAYIMTHNG